MPSTVNIARLDRNSWGRNRLRRNMQRLNVGTASSEGVSVSPTGGIIETASGLALNVTGEGSLITIGSNGAVTFLPVGSTGQVLTVSSTSSTNLAWATPSSTGGGGGVGDGSTITSTAPFHVILNPRGDIVATATGLETPLFRTGDLITLDSTNTAVRLAVGVTPGMVLAVTSTTPTKLNWVSPPFGTVDSVALQFISPLTSVFSVTGSPITSSGIFGVVASTQFATTVWAGPSTGSAAAQPTFRQLSTSDIANYPATPGTVTSVGLSLPTIFTVSGSPVTTTGTLTAVLASEPSTFVLAGPASGASAIPTFRQLSTSDISGLTSGLILASDSSILVSTGGSSTLERVQFNSTAALASTTVVTVSTQLISTAGTPEFGVGFYFNSTRPEGNAALYASARTISGTSVLGLWNGSTLIASTNATAVVTPFAQYVVTLSTAGSNAAAILSNTVNAASTITLVSTFSPTSAGYAGFFGETVNYVMDIAGWNVKQNGITVFSDAFPGTYATGHPLSVDNPAYTVCSTTATSPNNLPLLFSTLGDGTSVASAGLNIGSGAASLGYGIIYSTNFNSTLFNNSALSTTGVGVTVVVDNASLIINGSNQLQVQLNPTANNALTESSSGLAMMVDGTSIINAGGTIFAVGSPVFPVLASDPAIPTQGQAWYNNTTTFAKFSDVVGKITIGGLLYAIPSTFKVSGTGTSLSTFGAGPILPTNSLVTGRTLQIKAHGTYSTGVLTTSVVLGVVLVSGSSTVTILATVLPASGIAGGLAALPWAIDTTIAIQSSGPGGSLNGLITLYADNAAVPNISVGLGGGTEGIDTTQTWRVDCGVIFGTSQAGNAAAMDTEFISLLA